MKKVYPPHRPCYHGMFIQEIHTTVLILFWNTYYCVHLIFLLADVFYSSHTCMFCSKPKVIHLLKRNLSVFLLLMINTNIHGAFNMENCFLVPELLYLHLPASKECHIPRIRITRTVKTWVLIAHQRSIQNMTLRS
jgi:hypothetical protein